MKTCEVKHVQTRIGSRSRGESYRAKGIVTARSENLYGCNRCYLQSRVDKEGKLPDSYWTDEDDIVVVGPGVTAKPKTTGGPMSKVC